MGNILGGDDDDDEQDKKDPKTQQINPNYPQMPFQNGYHPYPPGVINPNLVPPPGMMNPNLVPPPGSINPNFVPPPGVPIGYGAQPMVPPSIPVRYGIGVSPPAPPFGGLVYPYPTPPSVSPSIVVANPIAPQNQPVIENLKSVEKPSSPGGQPAPIVVDRRPSSVHHYHHRVEDLPSRSPRRSQVFYEDVPPPPPASVAPRPVRFRPRASMQPVS